ncbi:hypothetical protein QJS10_CPA07g01300 [Acorus calamus]|uniref:Uncharacterized protein n=1 Tax=Acorus calamus TaxID=4465 RepID=A0AAV9EH19_ACOCL|nr:hypothetical protein QJS10_CPA07g01300 [Acorus calamus]
MEGLGPSGCRRRIRTQAEGLEIRFRVGGGKPPRPPQVSEALPEAEVADGLTGLDIRAARLEIASPPDT